MTPEARVRPTVEAGPNYIFHLLALSQPDSAGKYAIRCGHHLDSESREILLSHQKLLKFGDGEEGDLTFVLILFPAYLNLNSAEKLDEYFSLLASGLRRGDCRAFYDRYRSYFDRLRLWLYWVDHHYLTERFRNYAGEIQLLGEVYVRCFPGFARQIWPEEAVHMHRAADKLREKLDGLRLVSTWEQLTGKRFRLPYFEVVLCTSNEDGPDANSLGYDRTLFWAGRDSDSLLQLVSHEVGTHILIDTFKSMWAAGDHNRQLLYWGYENLARHYNARVLGRCADSLSYGMPQARKFIPLLDELDRCDGWITPERLLVSALEEITSG